MTRARLIRAIVECAMHLSAAADRMDVIWSAIDAPDLAGLSRLLRESAVTMDSIARSAARREE